MLRVILIDDEIPTLEELAYILNKNEDVKLVDKFVDPLKAIEQIKQIKPDVVFLDIQMPQIDGISAAREILKQENDINIVFVTGFETYAVKAFEINAIDYVLKPFSEERLKVTIDRIIERNNKGESGKKNLYAQKTHEFTVKHGTSKIAVWKDGRIFVLKPNEILYCTIHNREVEVVMEQSRYTSQDSLNDWEDRLKAYNFFRCHRSFLVNIDRVQQILPLFNNTYSLKLKGISEEITVSRNYTKQLKQLFNL